MVSILYSLVGPFLLHRPSIPSFFSFCLLLLEPTTPLSLSTSYPNILENQPNTLLSGNLNPRRSSVRRFLSATSSFPKIRGVEGIMMPLPEEHAGESAGGDSSSQRTLPTPFLTKTYQIVDDSSLDDLISWNEDGTSFIVWKPAEFARDLLPKYFKHNNFSSFVRQLNTYGFRKVVPDRWEFSNDFFKKGEKGLLRDIQRRKLSPAVPIAASMNGQIVTVALPPAAIVVSANSSDEQVLSSNSSPTAAAPRTNCTTTLELVEENERLRRENAQLHNELNRLRGLCGNVYSLMSTYASGGLEGRLLDLMPVSAVRVDTGGGHGIMPELSPRLFGVPIGVKRVRHNEEREREMRSSNDQVQQQQVIDVKSQPLDAETDNHGDHMSVDK